VKVPVKSTARGSGVRLVPKALHELGLSVNLIATTRSVAATPLEEKAKREILRRLARGWVAELMQPIRLLHEVKGHGYLPGSIARIDDLNAHSTVEHSFRSER
jgi:hypothetical protein